MITPRQTRLVRVADLHAFRTAIVQLASAGTVVLVPTAAAARLLARQLAPGSAVPMTRDELYECLRLRLSNPPRLVSALERDVLAQAAARAVVARGGDIWFQLRPGLVGEMLRFYDLLRRHMQQVGRFQELIEQALGGADIQAIDRGAERMHRQTRFLAETFREYQRRLDASGGCDEHTLRDRLLADAAANPLRHVLVTLPDWIADPDGLFVADFDLLARIPGLERIDIVATESTLASGFHERLREWWPGLAEVAYDEAARKPMLVVPDAEHPWWTLRDREEEMVAVARQIHGHRRRGDAVPDSRSAVVFKRPLPYVYLASEVFPSAGIRFEIFDATPLAAEPTAAAIDLTLEVPGTDFTRAAIVALLRSPHFVFQAPDGLPMLPEAVGALDRTLSEKRYLGGIERLQELAAANPVLGSAAAIARELAILRERQAASTKIAALLAFWSAHVRPLAQDDPFASRERRARASIVEMLTRLADALRAQDDPEWTVEDLAIAVRRLIEEQTFVAESSGGGVALVDDRAARYGDFDDIAIVGMVESDWPDRPGRNIFYPPRVLKALGWPSEADRNRAARARFLDLVSAASRRTTVSTFTLEDDAVVMRSMQLDEIPRARLSSAPAEAFDDGHVFAEEMLSRDPIDVDAYVASGFGGTIDSGETRAWSGLRTTRGAIDRPAFHGSIGAQPSRAWSVSALETYLSCPFKFFAQHVLRLEEEPDDEEVMDPRKQGQFVHEVFERFYREWLDSGRGAITADNLDGARTLFTAVVDRALASLSDAEAGLERTRLLGSPAAAGLGEAVFRMEAERPIEVVDRKLEYRLDGSFSIATSGGDRSIALKGKADRIDLLADGTFRLIDYKLGWPPDRGRALQLPIYGICAEQQLAKSTGRHWTLGEAAYIAFKGPRRIVPLYPVARTSNRETTLADAQQRLADTVDAIERGEFPPTPDDVFLCETCSYMSVCRKDYVGDV